MKSLIILISMFICSTCFGARVCVVKSTGKLIEYQSHASEGTLIKNAIGYGYKKDDIEEREVTKEEWAAIEKEWITDVADAKQVVLDAEKAVKKEALKTKFKWTDEDIANLKEILE